MSQLAIANLRITSWEVIVFLILVGGGFLLGILLGRDRIFILLVGSYISSALMSVIPFKKFFPGFFESEGNFVVLIVAFLVLIGIVYFIFSGPRLRRGRGLWPVFQAFFYALFLVGIVLTMVFSFLPKDLISQFSDLTLKVFNTSLARVLWLAVPLAFIGIFRNKRSA